MEAIERMRAVLADYGSSGESTSTERRAIIEGHSAVARHTSTLELDSGGAVLAAAVRRVEVAAAEYRPDVVGAAINSAVGRTRQRAALPVDLGAEQMRDGCELIAPPTFDVQSDPETVLNAGGDVMRLSRADGPGRTLEVAAATGEFGGVRWPSSETFLIGWNRVSASIGGVVRVPPRDYFALLRVTVRIRVERVTLGTRISPEDLIQALPGAHSLPLRGLAIAELRTSLWLHGAQDSAGSGTELASRWATRDVTDSVVAGSRDNAPTGLLALTCEAIVQPATTETAIQVFVDAESRAGAEETSRMWESAFALAECRDKPVTEITGLYAEPARLRVDLATAHLCRVPVLSRTPTEPGRVSSRP